MASVYLGIDVGTTSTKCAAVDENGEIFALAQYPYPMHHPHQGWAEQDPEDYWRALKDTVSKCVSACLEKGFSRSDIKSLAMSTQGDTLIVMDLNGSPLMPAVSWMDTRAEVECREMLEEYGSSFWYRELGLPLTAYNSACAIRWISRNMPDVWNQHLRFCFVPDFLAFKMCSKWISDIPSASWSPFYTPSDRQKSPEVLDILGISADQTCDAVESGTVIGEILPDVAEDLGLAPGVLLVAGAFDQAAAAHGSGATSGGRSVLSCGTAWVLYSVSASPVIDKTESLCICCHTKPSEWGLVLPFTGGSAYDWVQRTVSVEGSTKSDAEPLIFIPHLYGAVSPDWRSESKGTLIGLTMTHTPEDIRLAMMRGIAFEARRNLEAAEPHSGRIESLRMVGGAGKSDIWPQMIADIVNASVEVSDMSESACYGAAKLAAGESSLSWEARDTLKRFNPRAEQVTIESRLYNKYLRFYETLLELYGQEKSV